MKYIARLILLEGAAAFATFLIGMNLYNEAAAQPYFDGNQPVWNWAVFLWVHLGFIALAILLVIIYAIASVAFPGDDDE